MDTTTVDLLVDLLLDLDRAGVQELVPDGDRLRFRPRSAVTPELDERLRIHKADLLVALRLIAVHGDDSPSPVVGPVAATASRSDAAEEPPWSQDTIDPPAPSPCCGGLMFWWTPFGDRRCLRCDPPTAAIRLLEMAERIRRRLRIPSPAGAAEMLADLQRLTTSGKAPGKDVAA